MKKLLIEWFAYTILFAILDLGFGVPGFFKRFLLAVMIVAVGHISYNQGQKNSKV